MLHSVSMPGPDIRSNDSLRQRNVTQPPALNDVAHSINCIDSWGSRSMSGLTLTNPRSVKDMFRFHPKSYGVRTVSHGRQNLPCGYHKRPVLGPLG